MQVMFKEGKIAKLLLGAAILAGSAQVALAGKFEKPGVDVASATVYANTLPPMGYVDFCSRDEDECKFAGGKADQLALTTDAWDQVIQVNRYVNTRIRPVTDLALYGVMDYWTYPVDAGDCEDYVLLKKRQLSALGFSPDKLLITVVLDERNEGHAVLTIPTDKGDYVLDNRRNEILRWDQTGYTFLKRQSQPQANQWVSLQKAPATSSPAVSSAGTN
jgi:predicted transglutaminase-like cysteine proteinase